MHASTSGGDAERQLTPFIRKFSPVDQRLIRAVRNALRKRFATANELVYDNYNFFVIGYSPTERPSDAIVSMAARAHGLGLCFIHGAKLPDPNKVPSFERKLDDTRLADLESLSTPILG